MMNPVGNLTHLCSYGYIDKLNIKTEDVIQAPLDCLAVIFIIKLHVAIEIITKISILNVCR